MQPNLGFVKITIYYHRPGHSLKLGIPPHYLFHEIRRENTSTFYKCQGSELFYGFDLINFSINLYRLQPL